MNISRGRKKMPDARAAGLIIGNDVFTVCLLDGRQIVVPFHSFPRLDVATPQERAHFEVYAKGRMLHWPEIDEDIEVQHIAEGRMPVKEPATRFKVAESREEYETRTSKQRKE